MEEHQNILGNVIDSLDTAKMICDNACKKLFGNIEIASYIINHVCREYKSLNHEEVKKCIQHEPLISEVNLHDYENKSDDYQQEIRGLNVEHSSNLEGTVRFDSLLDALNPITKENITIIFNIEGIITVDVNL